MATEQPNYKDAVTYWSSQPTTVDGMLGGYGTGRVPRLDVQHSNLFLRQLQASGTLSSHARPSKRRKFAPDHDDNHELKGSQEEVDDDESKVSEIRTVDCGAGIGRVTKDLLVQFSDVVDLVEPCTPFTEEIKHGSGLKEARIEGKIGEVYTMGLQDFNPLEGRYTIIWNQWCLGQLSDPDLVAYLTRCKVALKGHHSLVFVKENIAQGQDVFDHQDSSWTRSEASFLKIFKAAGLKCVKSSLQHGFPKELYQVKLWALK